jgi:Raf kinase inhibitor-like YbhB/YbcL family protein
MAFVLTSSALDPSRPIPVRYTCDGQNVSPPLAWSNPPAGTASFALIMDDPDAPSGTFTHWMLCDLQADQHALEEDVASVGAPAGAVPGRNDFGALGYGGPCPPKGHGAHRYDFRLYALAGTLTLARGYSRDEFDAAIEGRVLAVAALGASYERRRPTS